jgi:hypothetical protein
MRSILWLAGIVIGCAVGFAVTSWWLDQKSNARAHRLEQTIAFQLPVVDARMLKSGWSPPESWGVWSNGATAELSVLAEAKIGGDVAITLEADAYAPPPITAQAVRMEVNGHHVGELSFVRGTSSKTVTVSEQIATRNNPIQIALHIASPRSPAELGLGTDTRKLGLGLRTLTLRYPAAEIVQK